MKYLNLVIILFLTLEFGQVKSFFPGFNCGPVFMNLDPVCSNLGKDYINRSSFECGRWFFEYIVHDGYCKDKNNRKK